jgi:hypothetical protein
VNNKNKSTTIRFLFPPLPEGQRLFLKKKAKDKNLLN